MLTRLSIFFFLLASVTPRIGAAQQRVIQFPDVAPYHTLVADLHMHTVFSDGSVWPNIRVEEAHKDGLDAIAITEHLEYLPHRQDIPFPDRNRAHEVAQISNGQRPLLVINGSEVTRPMPLGHINAVFVKDANALVQSDSVAVIGEANRQGAFVFWNHPHWLSQNSTGLAELTPLHRTLIEEGLLHGIEVGNEGTYSDEALAIALEHNLAILATSDIHGLVDWTFEVPGGGHRPVTLVFALDRTQEALKKALLARRTVAYFKHTLIGREADLIPLLSASVQVEEARYVFGTQVLSVTLANRSSTPFVLRNVSEFTLHEHPNVVTLPPHGAITLRVKTGTRLKRIPLVFEVLNAITAPGTHPTLAAEVQLE